MKSTRAFLLLGIFSMAALSSSFFNKINSEIAKNEWNNGCSSRDLASLKNSKFTIKEYADANKKLEKIDLNLEENNKDLKFLQEKSNEISKIKKEIQDERATLVEKSVNLGMSITGLESELNFKLDDEIEKALKEKSKPMSEEKKKELSEKISKAKKDKEALDIKLNESNLLIENAENLLERSSNKIESAKEKVSKTNEVKDKKEDKIEAKDQNIVTIQEQLCDKERKIAELEKEVEENIKDKEEIAKIISRKHSKNEEKLLTEAAPQQDSYANMQMMMQQMSFMMQSMQMQQMQLMQQMNNRSPFISNGWGDQGNGNMSPSQYFSEMQLAQRLGQGVLGANSNLFGPSAPITNNYYYGQNPYIQNTSGANSPYFSGQGGFPVFDGFGSMGNAGFGGQQSMFPSFNRGNVDGSFFNFGQTPQKI